MDEMFYALVDWMDAQTAYSKAKDEYEGYSWGYASQHLQDRLDEAKERFSAAFKTAVREVMAEPTDKAGG